MSDIPTPDPGGAAEPAAAEPAPDLPTPAAPDAGAAVEGGELDISTLPAQAQEYIRELREESKGRRIAHDPYDKAFSHFNDAEKEYLLGIVDTLGTDQEAGVQQIENLARQIKGIEDTAAEVAADPALQAEAAAEGLSEQEYRQIVQQEMEAQATIAEVENETRALGFEPGSVEAGILWDTTISMLDRGQDVTMAQVAEMLAPQLGVTIPEADSSTDPEPAPVVAEPEPEFPSTPTIPAGTAGTNAEEKPAPLPLGSQDLTQRVMRRFEQAGQQPG